MENKREPPDGAHRYGSILRETLELEQAEHTQTRLRSAGSFPTRPVLLAERREVARRAGGRTGRAATLAA